MHIYIYKNITRRRKTARNRARNEDVSDVEIVLSAPRENAKIRDALRKRLHARHQDALFLDDESSRNYVAGANFRVRVHVHTQTQTHIHLWINVAKRKYACEYIVHAFSFVATNKYY